MPSDRRDHVWLVVPAFVVLTLGLAYPLSIHPHSHAFRYDSDAKLIQWILGWDVHAFLAQPLALFDANIFAPLPNTLAYAEHLIGSAVLAAPVIWLTDNYFLATNLVALLSIPLSGLGAYLLARRLGVSPAAAFLAGVIFAFAPPRFFRVAQLQLTTIQWMPFCLAWVHQYLDEGRPRHLRLALVMFTLQALAGGHGAVFLAVSIGGLLLYRFGLGEPLALVRRVRDAGVIGIATLAPIGLVFLPYLDARDNAGLQRNLDGWGTSTASFFASPSHVHTWIAQYFPETWRVGPDAYLFPGYLPLLLPLAGLIAWILTRRGDAEPRPLRQNSALYYALLAGGCFWLLQGPPYGIWQWVYDWPVLNFIRVPTRFSLVLMLALGVLAALAFERLSRGWSSRRRNLAAGLCAALLIAEFAAAPLDVADARTTIPAIDRWLATQPRPFVVAELPMPTDADNISAMNDRNAGYMLHSMVHWEKTVHGFSGVLPEEHHMLYRALSSFPNESAIARMRGLGVTHVLFHADMTDPETVAWVDGLFAQVEHDLLFLHQEADGRAYLLRSRAR